MKLKYRKQFFRAISLLLIIALLCPISLNTVAIRANAAENVTEEKSAVKEDVIAETVSLGDTLEVPGFVSQAQIEEHGHVSRLVDEETLNTLVYLNRDGTKTKYIMDYPVKYIDENGDTKFVDLSLGETTTAFETTANDIVLSVSKDYTKGITLTYKDYTVSLVAVPNSNRAESGSISTAPITVAAKNNNAITYNDVFATDIDIRYSPLHNGVKEDIILQAYNGTNTFHFLLSTSGLGVYSEKDNYYLAEAANADMRMDLGKVIVYDANRKISEGSLTVTTLKENQLYQVTVSVDQAFLADPNTVYPVQIDPSITVSDTTHGANAVTDCPVYSGKPTVNMGTALYNPIGYLDSAYQIGRTAVKLVGLANDPVYQGLSAAQIQSAYFYIKDSSGTAAKSINLYALTSNSTWTESSLTWNTLGTVSPTLQASANVGGGAWSSFNITNLVKGWNSSSYNINCGFILQSSNESAAGNFFSSESAESNWPYLVLNYTVGTSSITLSSTSTSIVEGGTRTLVATTNPTGQTVTWSTSNSAVATVSSSGVVTAKKAGTATITASMVDPNGITKTATCVVYVYIANGVYYIKNMNSNYYLHVDSGHVENYTDVHQYIKYVSTTSEVYRIRQMWKICHLGNGRYSIRPMNKLNMGLDVTGNNVDIFNIGESDTLSSVPSYGEWSIEWYSTGYVFKNNDNSGYTMQVKDASTSTVATIIASTYSTSLNCRWELTKMTESLVGLYLYDTANKCPVTSPTKYVAPKESRSLSNMSLVCIAYSPWTINQAVSWYTSSEATVNSAGTVTGVSPTNSSSITVTANKIVNGYFRTVSYKLVVTEIPNGTYSIKNKETARYVDIEGPTMAAGTLIHQYAFHGGNSQRWTFSHLGDGTYSIKSAYNSSYYMGVKEDSTDNDAAVVLRSGAITNGMKWKVVKSNHNAYKIIPKTGEGNNRVLAVGWYILNTDGIDIQQRDFVDDINYKDEWQIVTAIDIGFSTDNYTDGCDYDERQSYRYANKFFGELTDDPGEKAFDRTHHYNMDSNRTASKVDFATNGAISNDIDFMTYIGHGLQADDSKGNYLHYNCASNGTYHSNDCKNVAYNAYSSEMNFGSSTSDLRWVWLYTCNFLTTNDFVTEDTLKEMMTGAHIVMGYASRATLCDAMAETFASYLREGEPIINAYFMAGHYGEASVEDATHYQRVLYIPQASTETIYTPKFDYEYDASDVLIITRNIHSDFS